jgi:hypothetical protein
VLATRPQLYARDRHFGEPTILAEIDELVPDDAAVVVNTSESVFRRSLRRPGTDRLWVRLALDQHQVAALLNRISPEVRPAVPPQWIQPVLRSDNAVASVGALLDAGRPVYISTLRAFKVKGYPQLVALLRTHFELELVARTSDGGQLHRIRPRAAARRFDGGATRG